MNNIYPLMNKKIQDMNNNFKFDVLRLTFNVYGLRFTVDHLQLKEGGRRLGRCAILLAVMVLGGMTVRAQSVIMNGNYYLTHNEAGNSVSSTATTSFDPNTCLWYVNNRYIRTANSNGESLGDNNYLQNTSLSIGGSSQWYQAADGNTVYHRSGNFWNYTYYYLRRNNTTWQVNSTNSNNGTLYAVTITPVSSISTNPTISGADVLTATGNSTYTATGASYQQGGYTNYYFNSTNHYFSGNTAITPVAATLSYSWSITPNDNVSVSGTTATGTVSVNSLPENDVTLTLTVTVTATDGTPAAPANTTLTNTKTITIQGTKPTAPVISVSGTTATLSTTAVGSTSIRYTLDGTDPTASTGTVYSGPIDLSANGTSPVTIKAITVRSGNASDVSTETVTLTLAAPVITVDGAAGTATITAAAGTTIYYTTDGSTPTTSSTQYTGALSGLSLMTTIKAIAVKSGWNNSPVASAQLTIPSGVSGGVVTLFDLEDHSWSYYSNTTCPVRSLGPADVKITYYGNGVKTVSTIDNATPASSSWTADATGVKVNVGGEDENCFIYYKTLERYNGETTDSYAYGSTAIYPYTTIPNPFQVRPLYGSGDDKWRGFYAWRIKDIKNGKIYTAPADGTLQGKWTSGNVQNTHILLAEHTYYFVPDGEYGMEVELEALWARAYVVECSTENGLSSAIASSTLQSTLSCERNFVVITNGSQVNEFTNASQKPVTISNLFPDGTGTVSNSKYVTGHFTANEDIKFENVYIRNRVTTSGYQYTRYTVYNTDGGSSYSYYRPNGYNVTATVSFPYRKTTASVIETWVEGNTYYGYYYQNETQVNNTTFDESMTYANTYNLTYGRGVQPYETYCANKLSGVSGSSNSNIDYTLRFESGTLGAIDLISDISYSFGGTVSTKCIIGCDYDRAKSDNTKLNIAPSSYIYGGNANQEFSSSSNRNNLTYDWLIKSGKVQHDLAVSDASADRAVYMGNSISGEYGVQYNGRRRLTMEGGEIASIAGGVDCYGENYADYGITDGSWKLKICIKGGTVRGSVYGAAAFGGASGDRRFVFTGGEINGWVAGGANGTQSDGGALFGASYLYVGGNTIVNSNSSATVINRAVGGNVFGAGCGYGASSTSGQVHGGTTVVIADNATIERGVYGGGSYGYTTQTSNIHILGGTINCANGGVNGTSYLSTVEGGVYGGACQNQAGSNIVKMYGGSVNGSVYGGCNMSGDPAGDVTVTVNGGTVTGGVYGCNNISGSPKGTVEVTINGSDPTVVDGSGNKTYAIGGVYGGGNQAHYDPTTTGNYPTVTVNGCETSIKDVYGGGNAAAVPYTQVTINGGDIDRVFGGGNGESGTPANVGNKNTREVVPPNRPSEDQDIYGAGTSTTIIHGGNINYVFGGSNSHGTIREDITLTIDEDGTCPMHLGEVFVGNNLAPRVGSIVATIPCGAELNEVYGCSNSAYFMGDVTLNIEGGTLGNVYGGSKNADIDGNVTVNVYGGHIGEVFGGNNVSGNISGTITVNVDIDPDYNCPDGLALTTVYGGGKDAAYEPFDCFRFSPMVNIKHTSTLQLSEVYGGGYGATAKTVSYPLVIVGGFGNGKVARVYNNVYGGGYGAPVYGNTIAMVRSSIIGNDDATTGTVFGGGYGTTAVIHGETYVGVFGTSDIRKNVYGGGNAGAVLGSTDVQVAYEEQLLPPETRAVMDGGTVYATLVSNTPDATIYYTKDGTEPTESSPAFSSRFSIEFEDNIQAIAYKEGMIPSVVSVNQTPTPTITITGSSATLSGYIGSRLYYTTDGTEPSSTNGTLYGGAAVDETGYNPASTPISVTANSVIKVLAVMRGCANSHVAYLQAPEPTINLVGNSCTITAPAGARIIYTTFTDTPSGSNPTSAMGGGTEHGTKVNNNTVTINNVPSGTTVKAIVEIDGYMPSNISAVKYVAP